MLLYDSFVYVLQPSVVHNIFDVSVTWLSDKRVSFDRSNNSADIDVKIDGSVLEEKLTFRMQGLSFSSKLD